MTKNLIHTSLKYWTINCLLDIHFWYKSIGLYIAVNDLFLPQKPIESEMKKVKK